MSNIITREDKDCHQILERSYHYDDLIFKNVQVVIHAGAMLPDRQALYDEGASFNANGRKI